MKINISSKMHKLRDIKNIHIIYKMSCGICFDKNYLLKTSCDHFFCKKCIKSWLQIKKNCPICRYYFQYDNKIFKEILKNNSPLTRSQTIDKRLDKCIKYWNNNLKEVVETDNIELKVILIDNIFKNIYENIILIRKNKRLNKFINDNLMKIGDQTDIFRDAGDVGNTLHSKIKMWNYKIRNA